MKALSVRQPWAWLIVNGYRDVENRSWFPPMSFALPQRIYIHAGLKHDYDAYEGDAAYRRLRAEIRELIGPEASYDWDIAARQPTFTVGAIVGEVDIVDVFKIWPSDWAEIGKYHFVLANPVAYEKPIRCKGKPRFFEPELRVRAP